MQEPEEDLYAGKTAEKLEGEIGIRNISFSYGEKEVFRDLSLTIPEGKTTAIIGASGSGKTTLLNLMERMYPIPEGRICLGKEDISQYSLKSYRNEITYITQEVTMFTGTIRDNLLFGLTKEATDERIEDACKKAGIWEFIRESKEGLNRDVGENGALLSGGQKQRLAFAKAFLKDSDYWFLDEATSAMDIRSRDLIWGGIGSGEKKRTVVMVAHDRQTIEKADYVIVLADGKIQAKGAPKHLAQTDSYFQRLMGKDGK